MSKRIQVRIFPDGQIQAEVQGVKGKKCLDYIQVIEELLEARTFKSAYTSEYYEEVYLSEKEKERIRVEDK